MTPAESPPPPTGRIDHVGHGAFGQLLRRFRAATVACPSMMSSWSKGGTMHAADRLDVIAGGAVALVEEVADQA